MGSQEAGLRNPWPPFNSQGLASHPDPAYLSCVQPGSGQKLCQMFQPQPLPSRCHWDILKFIPLLLLFLSPSPPSHHYCFCNFSSTRDHAKDRTCHHICPTGSLESGLSHFMDEQTEAGRSPGKVSRQLRGGKAGIAPWACGPPTGALPPQLRLSGGGTAMGGWEEEPGSHLSALVNHDLSTPSLGLTSTCKAGRPHHRVTEY